MKPAIIKGRASMPCPIWLMGHLGPVLISQNSLMTQQGLYCPLSPVCKSLLEILAEPVQSSSADLCDLLPRLLKLHIWHCQGESTGKSWWGEKRMKVVPVLQYF